jgi:hypothetical protein
MGLFKKEAKNNNEKRRGEIPRLPELPKLPELPEFSGVGEGLDEDTIDVPQLPTFPNGSLGNKFSRDTIKEAVAGKKGEEDFDADEFAEEEMPRMRRPLVKEERGYPQPEKQPETKEPESPFFVRIDKFEESFKILEEVRKRISGIEKMFKDIKTIREEEEKELGLWTAEINKIKEKIESIDNNLFSKLD